MAIGKGGSTGNQSGSQNQNFSGATSGANQSDSTQNGTSTGTSTGSTSGATTANPTAGYGAVSNTLQNNLGPTGLNAGQQDAYNKLNDWTQNPNNTVSQITAGNNQIQDWIKQSAPQIAGTDAIKVNAINPQSGADFMGTYGNPYQNDVVDASLADLSHAYDKTQAGLQASYGGMGWSPTAGAQSGEQVAGAQAADDYLRNVAATTAGLRSSGFNTAAGLGQTDASRALAAGQSNQATSLDALKSNAANVLATQEANANYAANKQGQNLGAIQSTVGNAVTAGGVGNETLQSLYNMAGGGNANLLNFMQSQVPAFGQSSTGTQTGTQSGAQSGTSSTAGSSTGNTSGNASGFNSGSSSGKNGGASFG